MSTAQVEFRSSERRKVFVRRLPINIALLRSEDNLFTRNIALCCSRASKKLEPLPRPGMCDNSEIPPTGVGGFFKSSLQRDRPA